jgi:serine/threonine-protein kinase
LAVEEMLRALDDLDKHWQEMTAKSCALAPMEPGHDPQRLGSLRHRPVKLPPKEAQDVFGLDDLWRPRVYLLPNQLTPSPEIVFDKATRLTWQRAGSRYPHTWSQAAEYIQRLNDEKFAGHGNWRLPTINELVTLLGPAPQIQDLCIAPLFDTVQRWLWSSDRRSFMAAYYVDVQLGFVGWQDLSAPYYVRAVCSASTEKLDLP